MYDYLKRIYLYDRFIEEWLYIKIVYIKVAVYKACFARLNLLDTLAVTPHLGYGVKKKNKGKGNKYVYNKNVSIY